jgi:hypothetical protein
MAYQRNNQAMKKSRRSIAAADNINGAKYRNNIIASIAKWRKRHVKIKRNMKASSPAQIMKVIEIAK